MQVFRSVALLLLTLWPAAVLSAGCGRPDVREDAGILMLEREASALEGYLAAAEEGPLVPFDGLLVTVRGEAVRRVIAAGLPHRATVGDRYALELERAEVSFRSGLALVELDGRASLAARPGTYAEVVVVGLLDVVGLNRERGTLAARVEVLGFRAREVGVGGLSPPVERLLDGLAVQRAEELNEVLGRLEIPVRLREVVELPAVEEPEVTIAGSRLPVRLEVVDVKVLTDRLWIALSAQLGEPVGVGGEAAPAEGAAVAPWAG